MMPDTTTMIAEKKAKVISINIVRGHELSEVARATHGIDKDELVEVRVERNSPANPKIIRLDKSQSPTSRFKDALKREGFSGKKFT